MGVGLKIKYLCPDGVLEVEQATLRELERKLPGEWFGYAGFQLFQRGQSQTFDVDLLLFTRNRALVIELKNCGATSISKAGNGYTKGCITSHLSVSLN
jgi:hypothetical protein